MHPIKTIIVIMSAALATNGEASPNPRTDVLSMLQEIDPDRIPLTVDEPKELRSFFSARVGVNSLHSFNPKSGIGFDIVPPQFRQVQPPYPIFARLNQLKLDVRVGMDVTLGLGLKLTDEVTIEIQSGLTYNPIDGVTGELEVRSGDINNAGEPVLDPNANPVSYGLTGGAGAYYQIPVTANLFWDGEIAEDIRFRLGAGVGVQWTQLQLRGIQTVGDAGVGQPPDFVPYDMTVDAPSIAVRYQATVGIDARLARGVFMGAYIRYSGTSQNNFGELKFNQSIANTFRNGSDVEVGSLQNFAFGITLTLAF